MSASDPWFLYQHRAPTGVAREVARESWVVQAERCRTAVERVLPDAECEILINLGAVGRHAVGENEHRPLSPRSAWIVGPHARPLFIEKEVANCDVVGIRLHVGIAGRAFGVSVSELQGAVVNLDDLWNRADVEDVRDRLHVAEVRERLAVVEQFVADRIRRTRPSDNAMLAQQLSAAVARMSDTSVAAIANAFGLTHRRVIEVFDDHVGLKPKAFQRVARLRRILNYVHDNRQRTWGQIAHACGYFDQAHLNNDFRRLSGMTPSTYAATRSSIGQGFAPHRLAVPPDGTRVGPARR